MCNIYAGEMLPQVVMVGNKLVKINLSPTRNFPIDLMLIHSCLNYHNILLNTDFSITFSAK